MRTFLTIVAISTTLLLAGCSLLQDGLTPEQSGQALASMEDARDQVVLAREEAENVITRGNATPQEIAQANTTLDAANTILHRADVAIAATKRAIESSPTGGITPEAAIVGVGAAIPPLTPYFAILGPFVIAAGAWLRERSKRLQVIADAKSIIHAVDALRSSSPSAKLAMQANKAIMDATLTDGAYNLVQANSSTTK